MAAWSGGVLISLDLSLGGRLAAYGKCEDDEGFDPAADLDASGGIDQSDLGALLADWTG